MRSDIIFKDKNKFSLKKCFKNVGLSLLALASIILIIYIIICATSGIDNLTLFVTGLTLGFIGAFLVLVETFIKEEE